VKKPDLTLLFPNDSIKHLLAGRIAGEIFQAMVKDDHLVGPADGILKNLTSVFSPRQPIRSLKLGVGSSQARHYMRIGEHVIVRIESAEFSGFLRKPLPHACPDFLVFGLPCGESIVEVAKIRVVE